MDKTGCRCGRCQSLPYSWDWKWSKAAWEAAVVAQESLENGKSSDLVIVYDPIQEGYPEEDVAHVREAILHMARHIWKLRVDRLRRKPTETPPILSRKNSMIKTLVERLFENMYQPARKDWIIEVKLGERAVVESSVLKRTRGSASVWKVTVPCGWWANVYRKGLYDASGHLVLGYRKPFLCGGIVLFPTEVVFQSRGSMIRLKETWSSMVPQLPDDPHSEILVVWKDVRTPKTAAKATRHRIESVLGSGDAALYRLSKEAEFRGKCTKDAKRKASPPRGAGFVPERA